VRLTGTKDYAGTYLIGSDGRAVQKSFIRQDAQGNIHTTENESEADQISTIVAKVHGDVLRIDVTLDVRRPIGDLQVDIYRGFAEFKRL